MTYDTRLLSPCASHDDHQDESPLSPPRSSIAKEGIEIVMPASPTSTIMADVYLLLEDDQVQHIQRTDDSGFYLSDASETSFCSTLNSTLVGSPFLLEPEPSSREAEIPELVFRTQYNGKPGSNSTIGNSSGRGEDGEGIQYIYSEDEEDEPAEPETELLGLSCLPDAMLCAPLTGFLEEDTWENFWGSACGVDTCKPRFRDEGTRLGVLAS